VASWGRAGRESTSPGAGADGTCPAMTTICTSLVDARIDALLHGREFVS
jgi:hypothetical protein